MVTFLPVVEEHVQTNNASLVLLSHVVGNYCLACAIWSQEHDIEFHVLFDCRRQLDLQVLLSQLEQLGVKTGLFVSAVVAQLGNFILGVLWGSWRTLTTLLGFNFLPNLLLGAELL